MLPILRPCSGGSGVDIVGGPILACLRTTMRIRPGILLVAPPLPIFLSMAFLLPHLPIWTLPQFLGLLPPTRTLLLVAILPFPGLGLLGPNVIPGWHPDPVPYRLLPVARYTG